ncbi:uncharacterized protein [Haliotis asinina]|uniref:uncharacterized protein n=1 Tax=Haliotis asinina TaxID=109174 RepID=UPI0035318345
MDLPNLALNKPTKQNSNDDWSKSSDRAVDGSHSTNAEVRNVELNNKPWLDWWQVDLRQIFLVLNVSITSRWDCCPDRLTNFTVEVHTFDPTTSNNSGPQLCYRHKDTVGSGLTVDLPCAVNTIGRYVRIVKYSSGDKPLMLCEVEVRGTSLRNTFGDASVMFSRQSTRAREPDYIIASHENIGKLDCANMCLREASCNGFNFRSPSLSVVSCELLVGALDPIKNVSWDVYTIRRFQCPSE